MIVWLLKELEKNPTSLFRKTELLKKSKKQFEQLKHQGFLTFVQPDPHHETYPCSIACSNTCPMEVVDEDGKLFAICPKNTEIDPIPLTKDDLSMYAFCLDPFLEQVYKANELGGVIHRIKEDFLYFGYTTYKGHRVGFVFGFTIARKSALEIIGLKRLCADDDFLVVFSPVSMIEDVTHKRELDRERIIQTSFTSSLNFQTFQFSIDKLFSGILEHRAETEQEDEISVDGPKKRGRNINPNRDKEAEDIMEFRNDGEKSWKEVAKKFEITTAAAQQKVRRYKVRKKNIKSTSK